MVQNGKGVNVIGNFHAALGLAESGRQLLASLEKQRIPFVQIPELWRPDIMKGNLPGYYVTQGVYDVNIFTSCAHTTTLALDHNIRCLMNGRYNIAWCFWEANCLPKEMVRGLNLFDEVWVSSHYLEVAVAKAVSIPVYHMPHALELKSRSTTTSKASFGLPDKYTFLFCFDLGSALERKNPFALIQAFCKAFPKSESVQLVIKTHNGKKWPEDFQRLKTACAQDTRLIWIDESMSSDRLYALMNVCDCYVSLHRTEGFGLTMAEAMLMEKPVIATGYSGNLEFMNETNSFLCNYRLVPIGRTPLPYPPEAVWANADIDDAAFLMDYVVKHPEEALLKGKKARQDILQRLSQAEMGRHLVNRFSQIKPDFSSKSYRDKQRSIRLLSYANFWKRMFHRFLRAPHKIYKMLFYP